MKAKVSKPFQGVEDKKIRPRKIEAGEIIEGDLAAVAVAQGWAVPIGAEDAPAPAQPEAKTGGGFGRLSGKAKT